MKIECKTTNGLMKHLRNKHGISISGKQKQQLINQGYFHGYKGYRFFRNAKNVIVFNDYEQVNQTIIFDSKLKTILYEKIMFLETAIKSVVLQFILDSTKSGSIDDMFAFVIQNYNKTDPFAITRQEKRDAQIKCLNLKTNLSSKLAKEYKKSNNKIAHFYENNDLVPLWSLFEILMLGDFGQLASSLTFDLRDKISSYFRIPLSVDSSRVVFDQFIYALKDLRNAIAHNEIIYDARFLSFNLKKSSKIVLENDFNIKGIDFLNISDFVVLIIFFLKALKVNKTEQRMFVNQIINAIDSFKSKVGADFYDKYFTDKAKERLLLLK